MLPRRLLYFLFFFIAPALLRAQIPDIRFEKYTTQDGLAQNSTSALLKDSHGFLWIGTGWGLNRYDGRVMKQYNKIGTDALPDLRVTSIAEDNDGNIWIGTPIGLGCMNPYTEKFTNYVEGTGPQTIPHNYCSPYVDKEKNIWIGDSYGISLFDKKTNSFTTFPLTTAGTDTRINRYTGIFLEDSKGRFWIGTSYGIKLFDRKTKTYRSYHFDNLDNKSNSMNATQGMFEDKDGNIWAGTWNNGILKFNPDKNIFEVFRLIGKSSDYINSVHSVNAITLNNHYYLLLATGGGLALADPQKISQGELPIEEIIDEPLDPGNQGLNDKSVILKDDQGIYWISGLNGLLKIDANNQVFQWKKLPDQSFSSEAIFHVIPDLKNSQQIVFLTTTKGWWKYDIPNQSFSKQVMPKGYEALLGNINRYVITENGYWFTSQQGVGFYNPATNTIKDISLLVQRGSDKIRTGSICRDDHGRIWFSVYRSGIRVYDPKTEKLDVLFADSTQPGSLYGKSIFAIEKAVDGTILLTTGEKLYQINPEDFSFHITNIEEVPQSTLERIGPRKILFDKENRVVVLGQQRIYKFENDKLIQLYPQTGSADFLMDDLLQDGNGDYWITTNLGLFKTDPGFKEWVNMGDKILAGNFDNISEIFRTSQDEFILTAIGKIGVFSLQALSKNDPTPNVIINRLRTGNKEEYLVSLKEQHHKVSFKDAVEIEMSAINFSNEKGTRIYYQLQGRGKEWKELTGRPVIRYEQLPPDHYTLIVKAMNGDGGWGKETTLLFTVLPPFWRTWWFIGIVLIVVATLLYSVYRYRLTKALELEKMRTRIATDLHDDIGATLSSISMYSDAVKQQVKEKLPHLEPVLDKMGENSRDMVTSMSDIVWAINPNNDDGSKLIQRMENYARDLCAMKNVLLQFKAGENINAMVLPLEYRKNIYLIFKEALNNALKYADAKNITISVAKENGRLTMTIQDDGKGFNCNEVIQGNGLNNIKERAKEINGGSVIESGNGTGTRVSFTCPIP